MKKQHKHKHQSANQPISQSTILILAAILLLTILSYSNTINNELVNWDDDKYITDNKYIKDLSWQGIKTIFTVYNSGNYHPLTTLTNAIEYKFFGLNPKVYHLNNLILHLMNVVLVFYFVKVLMENGKWKMENEKKTQQLSIINYQLSIPLIVALLFAIHPMHTESVAWAAERKDLLYSFFFLLALISSPTLTLPKREGNSGGTKISSQISSLLDNKSPVDFVPSGGAVSLFFFLLALFSKSAAVVLPLVLILIDYFKNTPLTPLKEGKFAGNIQHSTFNIQHSIKYIPYLLLSLIFGIVATQSQGGAMEAAIKYNFIDKLFLASYGIIYYLYKLIVPIHLSALHPQPIKSGNLLPMQYYFAFVGVISILFAIYKSGKYRRILSFGFLFFLINIILVLQLLPVGYAVVAERYTYISYIGLFYCLTLTLSKREGNRVLKVSHFTFHISHLILIVAAIIFSFITYQNNKIWATSLTMWGNVIALEPSAVAHYNRGAAQERAKAEMDYTEAIRLKPNYSDAYYNRAGARVDLEKFKEAKEDFDMVLKLNPKNEKAYFNRGSVKYKLSDYKGAIEDYTQGLLIKPAHSEAYNNRASAKKGLKDFKGAMEDYDFLIAQKNPEYHSLAYYKRGQVKENLNDLKGAIADYSQAILLNPKYTEAINSRAAANGALGNFEGVKNDFSLLINLNPKNADAYSNRGNAKAMLQDNDGAVSDYSQAILLNPKYAAAYFNRGVARLRMNKIADACEDWRMALQFGDENAVGMMEKYCN